MCGFFYSREHFTIAAPTCIQGTAQLTNRYEAGAKVRVCFHHACRDVIVEEVQVATVTAAPDSPISTLQNSISPMPEESNWVALLR